MDAGSEDSVFFSIYPDFSSAHSQPDASHLLDQLEELRVECLAIISPLVQGYVWQHTQFDLQVGLRSPPSHKYPTFDDDEGESPSTSSPEDVPLLHGKTRYGHNLEDEWFVVFLLIEISKRLPHLSIRVWDTDGEFLLIEAAYSIPRWLKPENSSNRVFIREGFMHIVPLEAGNHLSLPEALRALASGLFRTRASGGVQAAVERKIEAYPGQARRAMQRVRCRVPVKVAQLLKQEPQMMSLAVEAFYTRDHDALAAASKMEKLGGRDGEMVMILATMSRAMFAQLKQQVFQAPRGYPVKGNSPEDDIGLKVAVGFEMMYWEHSRFGDEEAPRLSSDAGWLAFRRSLESSGYFRGLLEGSREHRELMNKALARYRETESFARIRVAMQAPAKRVDEILSLSFAAGDFPSENLPPSDDDSWLYGGDEELTSAMEERQREMEEFEMKRGKTSGGKNDFDPDHLTSTMKSFVEKMSSFEGAEVPTNESSVSLDAEKFLRELNSTLNLGVGDGDEDFDSDEFDDDDDVKGKALVESDDDDDEGFMEEYSDALEQELGKSSLSKTFSQAKASARDEEEDCSPVNVDFNLLNNLLESYSSQQGLPGPASNILGMMGMQLPDNLEDHVKPGKTSR